MHGTRINRCCIDIDTLPILVLVVIIMLSTCDPLQTAYAYTHIDPNYAKLHLSNFWDPEWVYAPNIYKIVLYWIVIVIMIITTLKWTKYGRKVIRRTIIGDSILFSALSFIFVFESFYNIKIPVLFIIPYLILFLVFEHISLAHSNRLISFWKEPESDLIYVRGGTHIHIAYVIGTASRLMISILFVGSLFVPSRRGIINVNSSTVLLATYASNL